MRSPDTFARTGRPWRWVALAACSAWLSMGWIAVSPAGLALADCSAAGDFGAGSGCPPPGDTSGGGESWPPTGVDWPPSQASDSGGNGAVGKGDASTPIVVPDGQQAPPTAQSDGAKDTSTSAPPTPIVPVGAPASGAPPSAIVIPTSSTS